MQSLGGLTGFRYIKREVRHGCDLLKSRGGPVHAIVSNALVYSRIIVQSLCKTLLVKIKFEVASFSFDLTGIGIFEVGLDDVVPVLPYGPQACFLHNSCNDSSR